MVTNSGGAALRCNDRPIASVRTSRGYHGGALATAKNAVLQVHVASRNGGYANAEVTPKVPVLITYERGETGVPIVHFRVLVVSARLKRGAVVGRETHPAYHPMRWRLRMRTGFKYVCALLVWLAPAFVQAQTLIPY